MKYDRYLKYKWDNENVRAYAIKEREQAIKEAVTEAVNQAVKETRENERAKAILDERKSIITERMSVATEMKKAGIPVDQIAKFTKLSIEEIERL